MVAKETNNASTNLLNGNVVSSSNATSSASTVESTNEMVNAFTATNLEQWKALLPGLNFSANFGDLNSWVMEQTNFYIGIPITLERNGQEVSYKVRFANISIKNGAKSIMAADLYSPNMNIDETRSLGLKLCSLFGFDSTKFLAWCDKVGNHWMDAPLYGIGSGNYSLNVRHTFNNEKPWYIDLDIGTSQ